MWRKLSKLQRCCTFDFEIWQKQTLISADKKKRSFAVARATYKYKQSFQNFRNQSFFRGGLKIFRNNCLHSQARMLKDFVCERGGGLKNHPVRGCKIDLNFLFLRLFNSQSSWKCHHMWALKAQNDTKQYLDNDKTTLLKSIKRLSYTKYSQNDHVQWSKLDLELLFSRSFTRYFNWTIKPNISLYRTDDQTISNQSQNNSIKVSKRPVYPDKGQNNPLRGC